MGSAINKLAEEEVKSTQSFLRKLLMKAKQA
jgi:hydrogenase maturation factor